MNTDFSDFDAAYKSVLVKDPEDRFEQLAAEANFNIYHSDIWRGTARKFAESIVQKCAEIADNPSPGAFTSIGNDIRKHFGIKS